MSSAGDTLKQIRTLNADPHPTNNFGVDGSGNPYYDPTGATPGQAGQVQSINGVPTIVTPGGGQSALLTQAGGNSIYRSLGADGPALPGGPTPTMVAQAHTAGHGWVADGGGAGTVNLNDTTAGCPWGTGQCITITSDGVGGTLTVATKTGMTYSMVDRDPVLWVMVEDITKLKSLQIRMGDTGFANFFYGEFEGATPLQQGQRFLQSGGWVPFVLSWGGLSAPTGTPVRSALTQVRVTPVDYGAGAAVVHIAGFGSQARRSPTVDGINGIVSWNFDDGWADGAPVAAPVLDLYGWQATCFPIVDLVGQAGYVTLQQLKDMQTYRRWEVAAHANTAAAHTQTGAFTALADHGLSEMIANKQWLIANGFRGYDYFAYPQGLYDNNVIAAAQHVFSMARGFTAYSHETVPPTDSYRIRWFPIGGTITLAQAKAAVDEASVNGEWLIFVAHRLVAASPSGGSQWLASDFTALAAYVAAKGCTVRTMGDVLNGAPSPNAPRPTLVGQGVPRRMRAGLYVPTVDTASLGTANNMGSGNLRLHTMAVPRRLTLTRLAMEVTAAGSAGSVFRLAVYNDDGTGYPGALLFDSGVSGSASTVLGNGLIDGTSATVQEVTLSLDLMPGIYWVGAVLQGAPTLQPTVRTIVAGMPGGSPTLPAAGAAVFGFTQSGLSGALPAAFTTAPSGSSLTPRMFALT